MRLQDANSGLILCAFCGEAVGEMVAHLDIAHVKELTIINSNYQTPGNPVSRWIFEVRSLPLPPKPVSTAEANHHVEHTVCFFCFLLLCFFVSACCIDLFMHNSIPIH